MNRSHSKIRHMQNVNVLLEQRYILEQTTPIKNQEEANDFKDWLFKTYPLLTQAGVLNLDKNKTYSYNDPVLINAWNYTIRRGETEDKLGNLYRTFTNFKKNEGLWNSQKSSTSPSVQSTISSSVNATQPSFAAADTDTNVDLSSFYRRLLPIVEKAKVWWINWLNNEDTRIRFKKLNGILTDSQIDNIFNKYLNSLNNLQLLVFIGDRNKEKIRKVGPVDDSGCDDGALACVHKDKNVINANAKYSNSDDKAWYTNIIHEIQHLLYFIHPMTPNSSITSFRGDDNCYAKVKNQFESMKIEQRDIELLSKLNVDANKIENISTDIGVDYKTAQEIANQALYKAYNTWDVDYLRKNNSELTSRVSGTRAFLLYDTNRNYLTKNDIVKYIKSKSWVEGDINYVLAYWATKGFPPLEDFVNDLNTKFVKTDGIKTKQSPMDLPYKPKDEFA